MKIKSITIEYDTGQKITFNDTEIDVLQQARTVLEFLDTATNLANLLGLGLEKKSATIKIAKQNTDMPI